MFEEGRPSTFLRKRTRHVQKEFYRVPAYSGSLPNQNCLQQNPIQNLIWFFQNSPYKADGRLIALCRGGRLQVPQPVIECGAQRVVRRGPRRSQGSEYGATYGSKIPKHANLTNKKKQSKFGHAFVHRNIFVFIYSGLRVLKHHIWEDPWKVLQYAFEIMSKWAIWNRHVKFLEEINILDNMK